MYRSHATRCGPPPAVVSRLQHYCTIPEVIQEVKDKRARAMLDALPFELDVREPSKESVRFSAFHTVRVAWTVL